MKSAFFVGTCGILLTFVIGTSVLGWSAQDATTAVVATLISGLIAVITTIKLERTPWVRQKFFTMQRYTYLYFLTVYFSLMLVIAPPLRDFKTFILMLVPLIMCTGFTIIVFGPIQDRLYWKAQRLAAKQTRT